MQGCTVCNSELPRENVVMERVDSDRRIVYVHCDFCQRITRSLENRDGDEWRIARKAELTLQRNARAYRAALAAMHKVQGSEVEMAA